MNYTTRRNFAHLGTIIYRLSFIGLFAVISLLFSKVLVLLIYVILCIIGLCSLFLLFTVEDFRRLFDVTNSFNELITQSYTYIPMVAGISLAFIGLAILFLIPNYKDRKTRFQLIICIILFVLIGFLLIIGKNGGGTSA